MDKINVEIGSKTPKLNVQMASGNYIRAWLYKFTVSIEPSSWETFDGHFVYYLRDDKIKKYSFGLLTLSDSTPDSNNESIISAVKEADIRIEYQDTGVLCVGCYGDKPTITIPLSVAILCNGDDGGNIVNGLPMSQIKIGETLAAAQRAADSALAAKTSEDNAAESERQAGLSKDAAAVSEHNASQSQLAAQGYAEDAEAAAERAEALDLPLSVESGLLCITFEEA